MFLATSLSTSLALATVHVGDPAMNGSIIQPYDNVWLVTLHYQDGRVVERGLSTDHVRALDVDGKRYLSRIESEADVLSPPSQPPSSQVSSTFNIFDAATMAPLHGEARASDGSSLIRDFDGMHVTTRTLDPGAAEQTETASTAEPAFDFHGGMTGLLLAALPLKIGYSARLPGVGDHELDYTEIRVVRSETIKAGRLGQRPAWVVEIGPAPAGTIYWISKQAPYVLRCVVSSPKGFASWDIVN